MIPSTSFICLLDVDFSYSWVETYTVERIALSEGFRGDHIHPDVLRYESLRCVRENDLAMMGGPASKMRHPVRRRSEHLQTF